MLLAQESIQEAIRLHEACEYRRSTAMFGRLADPAGPNNPLSQVLYGLALRHGWGIEENPAEAMRYLQAAAKNSAAVEDEALRAGMKKGGTAKGELVLALYEVRYLPPCGGTARSLPPLRPPSRLGESNRAHGRSWVIRSDTDGASTRTSWRRASTTRRLPIWVTRMPRTKWAGATRKDLAARRIKYLPPNAKAMQPELTTQQKPQKKAARFYRMAEGQGNKILGNSW